MSLLSIQEVLRLVHVDPETGLATWKERPLDLCASVGARNKFNRNYAGRPALCQIDKRGYAIGKILERVYQAHRVVWASAYGRWPIEVDHINGIRSDNRIENLREVSHAENCRNQRPNTRNTSGVIGVCRSPNRDGRWTAYISSGGKLKHIGCFVHLADAAAARKAAEIERGYHPNHGRRFR